MGVWQQLMSRWFGLVPPSCQSCEILRSMLDESNQERRELLHRLIDVKPEPPSVSETEKQVPIQPQFIPWRVRQQMLEQEDRKKAQLMKDKKEEIEQLEKDLGVVNE